MKLIIFAALAAFAGVAQSGPSPTSAASLDAAARARVINAVVAALDHEYVFPEVAARIHAALAHRTYADATGAAFAEALTKDLRAISHDKHMSVIYSDEPLPDHPLTQPTAAEQQRMHEAMRFWNGGLVKVERLDGNVGYVRIDAFPPAADAIEHVAAAMSFVADTDALILDLRENHGGSPETVALYVSYLYAADARIHINDIYNGPTKTTREYWSSPALPGRRYADKPVYVLTSSQTFSGGEELAYDLATEKRATLVGETTGGGANPVEPVRIDAHVMLHLPVGRAINPITKTNWDGVGVKPDVAVPASKALDTAYLAALQRVRASLPKDRPEMLAEIDQAIAALQSKKL